MAKSAQQLFQEGKDWKDVGNVRLKRQLRNLYQENYRQQVAQATALNPSGRPEDLPTSSTYTVKDGDTLNTIAQTTGANASDILNANPDMTAPKTGMVLNAPRLPALPGSEAWRAQNASFSPGGLPSNAAIGATMGALSTYREGEKSYTPGVTPPTLTATPRGPGAGGGLQQGGNLFTQIGNALRRPGGNPYPLYAQSVAAVQQTPTTPQVPTTQTPRTPTSLPSTYPGGFRRWVGEEMQQINSPTYTPNPVTLAYLQQLGLIKKTPSQSLGYGGGGPSPSRRRGGGGGGRRPSASGGVDYANSQRGPAFGSGSGRMGLVNWRV